MKRSSNGHKTAVLTLPPGPGTWQEFHEFTVSSLGAALLLARSSPPLDSPWDSRWARLGLGPSGVSNIRGSSALYHQQTPRTRSPGSEAQPPLPLQGELKAKTRGPAGTGCCLFASSGPVPTTARAGYQEHARCTAREGGDGGRGREPGQRLLGSTIRFRYWLPSARWERRLRSRCLCLRTEPRKRLTRNHGPGQPLHSDVSSSKASSTQFLQHLLWGHTGPRDVGSPQSGGDRLDLWPCWGQTG